MAQIDRSGGFTLPFLLGTIVGVVSGTLVGVLVARRVIALLQRLFEKATGSDEGEGPRLDLLLQ
jgi:tetrahydromethanopterin S-methyltransferase subunit C